MIFQSVLKIAIPICLQESKSHFLLGGYYVRNLKRSFVSRIKSNSGTLPTLNLLNQNTKTESRILSVRLKSWWTRCRLNAYQRTLQRFPYERHKDGNHDANILFNEDSKTKARIRRTKQKLKETKVLVTKKMEDMRENILTVPNALCIGRIVVTPFLGYLVVQESYIPALFIFVFAGLTDMLDGYIARNFKNQKSKFGSFLDPAADKFLIATLFLTLTVSGLIPIPLTVLIVSRDICLLGAGGYIRYVSLPKPKTFTKFFDVTLATASVSPTFISKLNTAVQLTMVALSLASPVFNYVDHEYLKMLWYLTAGTTILSGASYLFTKNTYKIFKNKL